MIVKALPVAQERTVRRAGLHRLRGSLAGGVMAAVSLSLSGCTPPDDSREAATPRSETIAEQSAVGPVTATGEAPPSAIPELFRAIGTEPFWAVVRGNTGLRYMTPGDTDGTLITIESETAETAKRTITGTLGNEKFDIVIDKGTCSDGMSDRVYPFRVNLAIDDKTLSGCARPLDG